MRRWTPSLQHEGVRMVKAIEPIYAVRYWNVLGALPSVPLTGRQFRVLLAILIETLGRGRDEAHLGPKLLERKTGLRSENCYWALRRLKEWDIVSSPAPGVYQLNPPEVWRPPARRRTAVVEARPRHRLSARLILRVFRRDNFKCKLCGSSDDLTVDHIVPLLKGGSNEESNLQTLCRRCNSKKGARE